MNLEIETTRGRNILSSILAGKRVVIRYPAMTDQSFTSLAPLLNRLLSELDIGFLNDLVFIILKEITSNCSKANAKRIFFDTKKLDIRDADQYRRGMEDFTTEVLGNWKGFLQKNSVSDYYIKLTFQLKKDHLALEIENNAEILSHEWERIQARLAYFEQNKNLDNTLDSIRDESEGAGLGIVLIKVLLNNANISPDHFELTSGSGVTRSTLKIPRIVSPDDKRIQIKEKILTAIENLPTFPETITEIMGLCDNLDAPLERIAGLIQRDPSLTAQIIRLAGSAGYITRKKNISLFDAIKVVGLRMIRDMLLVITANNILKPGIKHREFTQIWEKSNRVAFFARNMKKLSADLRDMAFLSGLLHELGKIVLLSLGSANINLIEKLIGSGKIYNSVILEEIAIGISHSEIGALLGVKWGFPEPLVVTIRHHLNPFYTTPEYRDLVFALNLSVHMCESRDNDHGFHLIEEDILERFGLNRIEDYLTFVTYMTDSYEKLSHP